MPTCTSCNREIASGDVAVKFPCPQCAEVEIWRCSHCRRLANTYECPKCGFIGP